MDEQAPFELVGKELSIRVQLTEPQLAHLLQLAERDKRPKLGLADHLRRHLQALQSEVYHQERERRIERMSREKEAKEKRAPEGGQPGGPNPFRAWNGRGD